MESNFRAVRVKEGMSLRNGMWQMRHDLQNGIIMLNKVYAEGLKINKLTEERVLFSRQFGKSSSFLDVADSNRIFQ